MENPWTCRIAMLLSLACAFPQAARAEQAVLIGFVSGDARMAVRLSVDGATHRLGEAACQSVFADFSLRAPGPGQLSTVRFFDERDAPSCRMGSSVFAFTSPGSRVVHVCGRRFLEAFRASRTLGEVVIIHEFLHVLGLGENPPSSEAITAQVAARCAS
jgi:hypothetical protein